MQKWWSLFFGVVLLAAFLLCVAAPFVGWWLPPLDNKESFGSDIDKLFYVILVVTGFFFVLTEVILVWAMWKFTARPGGRSVYVHGNHKLEVAWTIVPAAILLFIAFAQISTWAQIKYQSKMKPPQHVIAVSARQFEWRVRYPDEKTRAGMTVKEGTEQWPADVKKKADAWGSDTLADYDDLHVVNEVHTWAGANTRIYLSTRDVLHSFFLPSMRLKQDAVPGKIIPVWFRPDTSVSNGHFDPDKKVWVYDQEDGKDKVRELACAELCGWGHYKMQGHLYIHKDRKSYDSWLKHALSQQRAHQREQEK